MGKFFCFQLLIIMWRSASWRTIRHYHITLKINVWHNILPHYKRRNLSHSTYSKDKRSKKFNFLLYLGDFIIYGSYNANIGVFFVNCDDHECHILSDWMKFIGRWLIKHIALMEEPCPQCIVLLRANNNKTRMFEKGILRKRKESCGNIEKMIAELSYLKIVQFCILWPLEVVT